MAWKPPDSPTMMTGGRPLVAQFEPEYNRCDAQFRPCRRISMHRLVSLFSILILLAGIGTLTDLTSAAQQQPDLNAIVKRFNEFYVAGNYAAALAEGEKLEAAVKARFGTSHANYAVVLNNLAAVYGIQGKYAQAAGLYQRALV